jgi:signal transduction histidine kinase
VQSIDRAGTFASQLCQPFEGKLGRLAASANEYGGDQTTADQIGFCNCTGFSGHRRRLSRVRLCFIVLFFQNRLLTTAYESLRALADDLTAKNAPTRRARQITVPATMSHELRTPLNAVIGFSEIISEETFGPVGKATYRDYAGDILRSGYHMLELVNDILTMAKLDAGRYELDLTPLDLRKTVDRTVDMFRGAKHAGNHVITIVPDAPWPWIEADERAVRQMMLNLLSNAAKFSEPDTPIEVRCDTSPDGEIVVTVIDRGIGMTQEETEQVARPFYQADSRLARRYEGSGLGPASYLD